MARILQGTTTRAKIYQIGCEGDSITDPVMNQNGPAVTQWTNLLEKRLNSAGAFVKVRNLAQSGAKTGGTQFKAVLNRTKPFLPQLYPPFTNIPDIQVLYSGTNDNEPITPGSTTWAANLVVYASTGHGYGIGDWVYVVGFTQSQLNGWQQITAVTTNSFSAAISGSGTPSASGLCFAALDTQTFLAGEMRRCQFGCRGYFNSQTSLPVDGIDGDRYVILYDTSTTGGVTVPNNALYNQLPQITGSITNHAIGNSEPTVWEYRSGQTAAGTAGGEASWARVARASTAPTHIKKFLIVTQHYMNFASGQGGDTQSTERSISSSIVQGGVRYNQRLAVSNEIGLGNTSVVLADCYQYFHDLIANGYETQFSSSWHRVLNDVHFSELGHSYMADFMFGIINAQSGWLAAISA